jgi:hypothetical protein
MAETTMVERCGRSTGSFSGKSVIEPKTSLKRRSSTALCGSSVEPSSLMRETRKPSRMSAK